jgi:Helix-turn-helix.
MKKMSSSINREIGKRIKTIREDMGISQTILGNLVGVSYQQIQKYENGRSTISAEKLDRIAASLKIPVSYFFKNHKKDEKDIEYFTEIIKTVKLNSEEKTLIKGYRSMKNKDARRGLLLLVKGLISTN